MDVSCKKPEKPATDKKLAAQLTPCILRAMSEEPSKNWTVRDLQEISRGKASSVKSALCRICQSNGPIIRLSRGLYRYDSSRLDEDLQTLARSGNWKIENLTFTSLGVGVAALGVEGGVLQPSEITDLPTISPPTNPSGATPRPSYPIPLPTGQQVHWETYQNGTQVIRLAAAGAPPFSADLVINLLHALKKQGFGGPEWKCTSMELNVDSQRSRTDCSYSFQLIEGLLLKVYSHANSVRIEIADRRVVPIKEVYEMFHSIAGTLAGTQALAEIREVKRELKKTDDRSRETFLTAENLKAQVSQMNKPKLMEN